jgi:hypothetical protein
MSAFLHEKDDCGTYSRSHTAATINRRTVHGYRVYCSQSSWNETSNKSSGGKDTFPYTQKFVATESMTCKKE